MSLSPENKALIERDAGRTLRDIDCHDDAVATLCMSDLSRLLDAARSEAHEAAYKQGWNDREDDLIVGVERPGTRQEGARGGEPVALSREAVIQAIVSRVGAFYPGDEAAWQRDVTDAADAIIARASPSGWRPIKETDGEFPLLVGREPDKYLYGPVAAFKDVTGVWRIHGSEGGMSRVQFEPTLVQDLPLPPTSEGGGA